MDIEIKTQPNDLVCGPTSLHSIYNFYNDEIRLEDVIAEVPKLAGGGTFAVSLGKHALERGYEVTIYSYNLHVIDPTWRNLDSWQLQHKLSTQAAVKNDPKLAIATREYIKFLQAGGNIKFEELTIRLLKRYFDRNIPILAGLSATYLYGTMRECTVDLKTTYDDLLGEPAGHFVVLCGYNEKHSKVVVADPYKENPVSHSNYYSTNSSRLLNAIMLGILTYDANLLVICPKIGTTTCI